jgi:hypothetical protein
MIDCQHGKPPVPCLLACSSLQRREWFKVPEEKPGERVMPVTERRREAIRDARGAAPLDTEISFVYR